MHENMYSFFLQYYDNFTTPTLIFRTGIQPLYTISYLWNPGIGICVTVIVGLIVSVVSGKFDISMFNPQYMFYDKNSNTND